MLQHVRLLLAIAWRNLARNPKRSFIASSGIAVGVGMGIAGFGIMDGMSHDMVRSVTEVQLGDVQAHEPGFSTRPKLDLAFERASELTQAAEGVAGVVAASPRVVGWALLSSATNTVGAQLFGVDPAKETALTGLDRRVVQGQPLPRAATPWPEPKALDDAQQKLDEKLTEESVAQAAAEIDALDDASDAQHSEGTTDVATKTRQLVDWVAPQPERPPPLLLGDKLARKLHAKPGSRVTLMVSDLHGDPANIEFSVVGLLHTGDATIDSVRAVAHLGDVQRLYALGDRAHELAFRIASGRDTGAVAGAIAALPAFAGLEVKSWQELRPDVVAMVQTNSVLTALLVAILIAVAAIGVADTILMAVFERRRELGMLKAVGLRPLSIVAMVTAETVLLSIGASVLGLVLGVGFDLVLMQHGIPLTSLSSFSLAGASIPPVLHAAITTVGVFVPLVCMVGMALVAALWPAWVAARTEPIVAMQDR
jgi:ABC-type lipoprotein release transport system permease subunit